MYALFTFFHDEFDSFGERWFATIGTIFECEWIASFWGDDCFCVLLFGEVYPDLLSMFWVCECHVKLVGLLFGHDLFMWQDGWFTEQCSDELGKRNIRREVLSEILRESFGWSCDELSLGDVVDGKRVSITGDDGKWLHGHGPNLQVKLIGSFDLKEDADGAASFAWPINAQFGPTFEALDLAAFCPDGLKELFCGFECFVSNLLCIGATCEDEYE